MENINKSSNIINLLILRHHPHTLSLGLFTAIYNLVSLTHLIGRVCSSFIILYLSHRGAQIYFIIICFN
jgi:hypothetical protein